MILSKVAANRLNMQAPELSKYVISFKDLTDQLPEDAGIECGMFILNISGRYMYIPVLAKAETVQMIESVFDAESKTFIPLTKKSVEWMTSQQFALGQATRIPANVARDPDLYDAIVPPKTGKFVYASEGRIGGFFASLPGHHKQAVLEVITNDLAFQNAIAPVMDIDIVREFLTKDTPNYVAPEQPAAPQVVTSGKDLSDVQVQEIMDKGYTVKNPPKATKVAVEADPNQAITYIDSVCPGTAYSAMKKNGDWVTVAGLRLAPGTGDSVWVTETGEILLDKRIVICAGEMNYNEVIEKLSYKKADQVGQGEYGMFFTGSAWYGPFNVTSVEKANGWTTISNGMTNIRIHPNIKTMYDKKGNEIYMSTVATFYPMKEPGTVDMENDINRAQDKVDIEWQKMLPIQANLMHRDGVYAVDGKEIGGKVQIIEHLLNHWEIDVPTVETLTKSASEKGSIMVKMAAVRQGARQGNGTRVQPIYESGIKLESPEPMTGNARQRALGAATKAKSVKDVADRETMEATIISEMLQNPDMATSIKEYLPDIKQAIDRLGRSLFLMRLNTKDLSDKIDAEALTNLFTSTRNAYRILGDNYVELQNLVAGE